MIHFLGDVYLPRAYDVDATFEGAIVLNLEHPITASTNAVAGKINLKADGFHIRGTFGDRVAAVNLANNHIFDYGVRGFLDTLDALDDAGIKYFGAGSAANNFGNPAVLELESHKVGLLGYVCPSTSPATRQGKFGTARMGLQLIRRDIVQLRKAGVDAVIVNVHWGAEEVFLPKPVDIEIGRAMVDYGADLIIGHHAHRIQPFELYRRKWIFYGLGNAVMPDLRVPAQFDNYGRPQKTFVKRQRSWNRKSLAVTYQPGEGTIQLSELRFRHGILERSGGDAWKYHKSIDINRQAVRFKWSYRLGKTRTIVARFIERPRLPQLRHIRGLIGILKPSEYR